MLSLSGVIAGLLSGLLGVGGGFVTVPALQRYTNLHAQSVLATSLAVIALVSVSGVISSAVANHLDWIVALPFSAGAISGMLGGRIVNSVWPSRRTPVTKKFRVDFDTCCSRFND
ncbi:sulfite exporter TauE/SafE family protein [Glaciimonas sp. CA11.2]|uniref:sulfite exporter TauE/SafE family protein n=1 Tax=unclassified Glaciimonas TaxID=2644401 RepID=UPI002AB3B8B4|nr:MULTISPECIES: sulfite exporter TauE/SafE family protein [unclassified Glaciimonas]MDY7548330.1 sulfite exporter TauE/SafE family protein [Glaciimonas sp. CA11.2]MEB0010520.1 sulfite exporter TauE/SafE family protein [Glaciimonas sp. Cout2]MEB0083530.1 sulfite exporter TauE/SafE family protein [Glaciimonas sp. Gout2]MEB0164500.1 sulfite exporter TauE/SafE family protein [Glaciimonas sp. CA11.2]